MKKLLKEKGITLVALVITIILLLILAGITINQLLNSGLLQKANEAKEKVINAQEKENIILSDLEKEINNSNRETYNEKEIKFYNGAQGFNVTLGEMLFNSYGLTYKTFDAYNQNGYGYISSCEKIEKGELNTNFEISAQIYFNNETTYDMGSIKIALWENEQEKCEITINDAWQNNNSVTMFSKIGEETIASTRSRFNASGRYAIVGDGNKIYFYWGTNLIGSIDYAEKISYDKITIKFLQYDSNHAIPPIYVESLLGNCETIYKK